MHKKIETFIIILFILIFFIVSLPNSYTQDVQLENYNNYNKIEIINENDRIDEFEESIEKSEKRLKNIQKKLNIESTTDLKIKESEELMLIVEHSQKEISLLVEKQKEIINDINKIQKNNSSLDVLYNNNLKNKNIHSKKYILNFTLLKNKESIENICFESNLNNKLREKENVEKMIDNKSALLIFTKDELKNNIIDLSNIPTENITADELANITRLFENDKILFSNEIDSLMYDIESKGNGTLFDTMLWPLPYKDSYVTSGFGYRTLNNIYKFHYGIDISVGGAELFNKKLIATADGTVTYVANEGTWNGGYGNYLRIDHGNGVVSVYGHCYEVLVKQGEQVKKGQAVAILGTTGNSTGPHVHFEIRINGVKVDPLNYLSIPKDVGYHF